MVENDLGVRLKAQRKALGLTQKDVGDMLKMSFAYISKIEKGQRVPEPRVRDAIEAWLSAYAQQPSPASPSAHVSVPRYEVQASAGGGAVVASEQIVDYLQFRPDWLKTVKGITPGNLILISVIGDSMEPTINDGDLILVDTTEGRFKSDAIYVMRQGDRLWVKRVHYKVDGSVLVKSDNVDKYEPELFRGDELENLKIVGRVVWRGGNL